MSGRHKNAGTNVKDVLEINCSRRNLPPSHLLAHTWRAQAGGELKFCLRMEPKTFDPLKVEDEASAAIRYLTGGVLVRVNRQTQELEPELAQSWNISRTDGRSRSACAVEFHFPTAHRLRPKTLPTPFSN